jgi:hypothetical protein
MSSRLDALAAAAAAALAIAGGIDALAAPAPARAVAPNRSLTLAAGSPAVSEPRASARGCAPLAVPTPDLPSVPDLDRAVPPLEDPTGDAMAPFYEKLARLLRGHATDHLRIAVYGDSNGTLDYTTGEMRRWLQSHFGDAGHGYVALAQAWPWYEHRDIERGADLMWTPHAVSNNWLDDGDAAYGHGLIVAEAFVPGATTWVATARAPARVGLRVDTVEIGYLQRPGGGAFDVMVDGALRASISTDGPTIDAAWLRLALPDAPHRVTCVTVEHRPVRLLGAVLERSVEANDGRASFVVDALGVGGAAWRTMLRDDADLDARTLRRRAYDLVVVHIGTNTWRGELGRATTMRAELDRLRAALPGAPLLVMDPPDHHDDYAMMDDELPPEQRKIAFEKGAAFFDFHAAMGGRHSMDRFFVNHMARGDMVHFNEAGGAYMARRVLYALFRDFGAWMERHPQAGCG